jgi:2-polyprenyl-3-methyl-5-hydroxy-6-metoxy-1,4-benzoquinol methylase
MTLSQQNAQRCGMIPEQNPPEFFAKHLSPYELAKKVVRDKRVLDVGFGDGYGMNYLSPFAHEVVGIDIAPDNIPLAQKKYPEKNLRFMQFDGANIPFEAGSFDVALSCQVIEHIPVPNLTGWLLEIARVLKKDGLLIVSTLNLSHAMKPGKPYHKNMDHEKEFTAAELENLLKKVFPRVTLYGLHYRFKHRVFKRLKKWGVGVWLPKPINFVKKYFDSVTVDDFTIHSKNNAKAIDLIAICQS